jgi:hypothetical protein
LRSQQGRDGDGDYQDGKAVHDHEGRAGGGRPSSRKTMRGGLEEDDHLAERGTASDGYY